MTRKPRQISGNEPLAAIPKDYNRYCDKIIGNAGGLFLQAETLAFAARVEADGGTVEDINFLNSFIVDAKANGYLSDIVAAYSPSWGVKGTTTASKLYSIIGAGQDLEQPIGASQPAINTNDLNGKTRLLLDGTDDHMGPTAFTFSQPETIALMGHETESWVGNDRVLDGLTADKMILYMNGVTPELKMFAGAVSPGNTDAAVGTPAHVRVLFNGASSAIQIDANAETTGDAGLLDGSGFLLGRSAGAALYGNISEGAIVLLCPAIDANYAAKMAAIYAFSKSAYGTP